jgi:hypothetical protein
LRYDAAFRRIGWPLDALAAGVVAEAYGPRAALLGSVAAVLSAITRQAGAPAT